MCILCAGAAAAAATVANQVPLAAAWAAVPRPAAPSPHYVANFVRPVLVSVFGMKVYTFGLMASTSLLLSLWVFAHEQQKARIVFDELQAFFVFLFGLAVGSKGHQALSKLHDGKQLTWQVFNLSSGHSFMGAIIGATVCMLIFIRRNKVGVLNFLDCLLPVCLLAHTIGKGGCFLSGDGCYGPPADPSVVPWAMSFPKGAVPVDFPVHPTPIYEAILSFSLFLLSMWALPLPQVTPGRRTAFVLVLYGFMRVCIEPFRRHPARQIFMGMSEHQVMAIVLLLIGAGIELRISLAEKKAREEIESTFGVEEDVGADASGGKRRKKE